MTNALSSFSSVLGSSIGAAAKAVLPDETRLRGKIDEAAQSFEASFLSTMMKSMFDGVQTGAFGGGEGEQQFKSFLMDAFAKQTVKSGGLGISDQVRVEMLKLQGLVDDITHADGDKA